MKTLKVKCLRLKLRADGFSFSQKTKIAAADCSRAAFE